MLNKKQIRFLRKRKSLVKSWPIIALIFFALIIGYCVWVYYSFPLLLNPLELMAQLETGNVNKTTLSILAAMAPLLFICITIIMFVMVMVAGFSMYRENYYHRIIQMLLDQQDKQQPEP